MRWSSDRSGADACFGGVVRGAGGIGGEYTHRCAADKRSDARIHLDLESSFTFLSVR